MKAPENMYIPEKIYLPYKDGKVIGLVKETGVPFKSSVEGNIEYTRTDAFIEKACELLMRMVWEVTYEDLEGNSTNHHDKMKFIEDFKNYMKGE